MPADQDKIATLRQAAAAKREAATARAETGIRKLTKTGQPVTFRAVAAASGVSVDFLYRHPELRARIERLRGHQPAPAGHAPASALQDQQPPFRIRQLPPGGSSSLPMIGRRLPASSSFVLAPKGAALRALQLDPGLARRHKPAATRKSHNQSPIPTPAAEPRSPGQLSTPS